MVIVDELLLSLGVTGTEKVKAAKSGVSSLMNAFGKLVAMAGGVYAVTTAIKDFVNEAVDLQRVSDITGESVENLSAWKQAIDAAGEDGAAFLGTVRGITENINDMLVSGSGDVRLYLNQLGVDIFDTNGQLKDTTEILKDVAGAWDGYSSREQAMIGEHLGIDEGTIRFLQRGGEEVESLLGKQKELGVITAKQAKAAQEVRTSYYQLQNIWRTTANVLLADLLPALTWILDRLKLASGWVIENKPILYGFLVGLIALLAKVAIAWAVAFRPVSLIIAALAALGTALYLLYDDYMVWKEGGIAAFGEVWKALESITSSIGGSLRALGRFFVDFWNNPKKVWDESIAYFENRWRGMSLLEVGADIIKSLTTGIKTAWDGYVSPLFQAIGGKFKQWFGFSLFEEGSNVIGSLWDGIANAFSGFKSMFLGLAWVDVGRDIGKWIADALVSSFSAALDFLTAVGNVDWMEVGSAILDGLKMAVEIVGTMIGSIVQLVYGVIEGLMNTLWDSLSDLLNRWTGGALDKMKGIAGGVAGAIGSAWDWATGSEQPSPVAALPSGGSNSMSSSTSVGTMNVYTKSDSPGAIRNAVSGGLGDVNAQNQTAWTADSSIRR